MKSPAKGRRARRFGWLVAAAALLSTPITAAPALAKQHGSSETVDRAAADTTVHHRDQHQQRRPQEGGGDAGSSTVAWAAADQATIFPGVQMITQGAQCTANFVYTDGSDVYLGYAAHCADTSGTTNGCEATPLPLGTEVEVQGADAPGTLAYTSWGTMQQRGEADVNTCAFNDFALVRIDPADVAKVNPSIPSWGGPVGLATEGVTTGSQVYSYGNSGLRAGLLNPKTGVAIAEVGDGWSHQVYTVTPGIPGDSGSAFVNGEGQALGVLVTVQLAPLVGSNGVTDLARALDYMHAHSGVRAQPVDGTEAFDASPLGLLSLSSL